MDLHVSYENVCSSDNRIDYTSIMVPRLNSGTVFQTDLYPTIQPIVLEYPGDWTKGMDQLDVAVEMACLKGSLRASNVPLGSYYIKSPPVSTTYPTSDGILQSDLRDLHSIAAKSLSATAILEQRGWFWSTWTRVVLRIRKNFLYVTALQDSTAILMVRPSHVKHIFMFPLSSSGHGLSMVYKGEELRFEMTSYEECQEWMEELENRIMLGDEEHIPGTPKRTVILLGNMRLLNQNDILQSFHQSERTLVLEEDMTLCIYASNQSYCAGEKPMNVLCLSELIGLHPVSLFASQCPSGNRSSPSSLPVSIFKLIFSDVSWFFLAKSQAIKELWIRKIRDSVSLSDFPGNNPIFYVELGKIPQSTRLLYKISGQGLWLTLLSDRLLYTESRFSRLHSAMLEIKSILSVNRVGDAKCGLHVEVTLTDGTTISHIFLSERQATEFTEAVDWMLIEAQDITKDLGFYLSRDIEAALDKLYNFSDMLDVLTLSDKIQFVRMLIRISGQHDLELVEPSFSSLTLADSFILIEDKMSIYHWHGSNSSFICRAKALDIATRIRKHLRDVPKVFLVDESDLQLEELFFMKLGSAIPRAMNFPAREIKEPLIKVFRVSSQSKKQICVVSSVSRPSKCVLLTTSSFVVQFNNIYFAWIGADSLQKDGRLAKMFAKQMAKLCSGYAALIYMNEGCEHPLFCVRIIQSCLENLAH